MRKVIVELIVLGIALGLTVEVIKSAIPYLPLIWLVVLVHYTWEAITSEYVLSRAKGLRNRFSERNLMYSYGLIAILGAGLLIFYWWGLNSFFAPRIARYETEQQRKITSEARPSISAETQSDERVPQIQLSADILPFGIDIPAGEEKLILVADNPNLNWVNVRNPKSSTVFWPSSNVAKNNTDMMYKYTVANLGKVNAYNLRAQLEVEFTIIEKKMTSRGKTILDIGFLFPDRPVTFYFVNRSMSSEATLYPPENTKIQIGGESQPREVPFTQLMRNPVDAISLPLVSASRKW